MKLAVSNIAWSPLDRLSAYEILSRNAVEGLEIAPGLFLSEATDPFQPERAVLERAVCEVAEAGLQLVSMQSLLFGVEGAALFGGPDARARLQHGMSRAIALAGKLGVGNLVFGSPKQRNIPEGMSMQDALSQATETFTRLGDEAAAAGTRIAVEFNPSAYGTNFLTHAEAAIDFVRQVDHPAVTLNFDIGAMYMNDSFERIDALVPSAIENISHVHVSEPFLAPAPASVRDVAHLLQVLHDLDYEQWISIEMKQPDGGLTTLETHVARLVVAAHTLDGAS